MNSRSKGKAGELQWAAQCRAEGFDARRGRQFHGGQDSPDVVCDDLPGLHFEVKRTQRFNAYEAMEQAVGDASDEQMPVVAHRRNHHDWLVVMRATDFFKLVRESNLPLTARDRAGEEE